MNIQSAQQTPYINIISKQSKGPSTEVGALSNRREPIDQRQANSFDFTNVSRTELNDLVKLGVLNFADIPLMLPEGGLDLTKDTKAQMDAVMDKKVDIIRHIEDRIESRESYGKPTDRYDNMLHTLLSLQGQPMQPSIDSYA